MKYLIIGNSAGGIGAAEAIREIDRMGSIVIVSDEPYPAYSRPLISDYLAGEYTLDRMLFRPADFYEQNDIDMVLGKKVVGIDLARKVVTLEDGSELDWEKLLLACGGSPIVPPIEGREKEGVFTFTTLDDAKRIERYLDTAQEGVVIGGGLIGISVTEALIKRKVKVTVVEMKDRVLNTILDEEASRLEETVLAREGIDIITGHTVREICSSPRLGVGVKGVVLDDGRGIPCDLVVMAIGVSPRLELVRDTELAVERGIIVDDYMTTNHPDVYACGDVAEAYDFIYGNKRLAPIWPNAYMGGRVAGFNMAGYKISYPGGTGMNSLKYFGLPIISAGMVNPEGDNCEVLTRAEDGKYQSFILEGGRIVGMVLVRDIQKAGLIFSLMRDSIPVREFKDALVADDFGLVFLPEELRRERMERSDCEVKYDRYKAYQQSQW